MMCENLNIYISFYYHWYSHIVGKVMEKVLCLLYYISSLLPSSTTSSSLLSLYIVYRRRRMQTSFKRSKIMGLPKLGERRRRSKSIITTHKLLYLPMGLIWMLSFSFLFHNFFTNTGWLHVLSILVVTSTRNAYIWDGWLGKFWYKGLGCIIIV